LRIGLGLLVRVRREERGERREERGEERNS
jgi:hypothetical protein